MNPNSLGILLQHVTNSMQLLPTPYFTSLNQARPEDPAEVLYAGGTGFPPLLSVIVIDKWILSIDLNKTQLFEL